MAGLTAIPLFVPPDHLAWLRWKIALIAALIVGLAGLALQLYFQYRAERKWKEGQEERDRALIKAVVAELQAAETPKPRMTHDSLPIERGMTMDDPLIYLSIEPALEAMFPRTPFICLNSGKQTAHKVGIQPFKLSRKLVTFPLVEVVPSGEKRDALPIIEKGGQMVEHDIFHWLMKDWNDNGELVEEWPVPIVVRYSDPLGRRNFEATMTLVFYPIWHMMNEKQDSRNPPDFIKRHRHASWEFKNVNFKLTG